MQTLRSFMTILKKSVQPSMYTIDGEMITDEYENDMKTYFSIQQLYLYKQTAERIVNNNYQYNNGT